MCHYLASYIHQLHLLLILLKTRQMTFSHWCAMRHMYKQQETFEINLLLIMWMLLLASCVNQDYNYLIAKPAGYCKALEEILSFS